MAQATALPNLKSSRQNVRASQVHDAGSHGRAHLFEGSMPLPLHRMHLPISHTHLTLILPLHCGQMPFPPQTAHFGAITIPLDRIELSVSPQATDFRVISRRRHLDVETETGAERHCECVFFALGAGQRISSSTCSGRTGTRTFDVRSVPGCQCPSRSSACIAGKLGPLKSSPSIAS